MRLFLKLGLASAVATQLVLIAAAWDILGSALAELAPVDAARIRGGGDCKRNVTHPCEFDLNKTCDLQKCDEVVGGWACTKRGLFSDVSDWIECKSGYTLGADTCSPPQTVYCQIFWDCAADCAEDPNPKVRWCKDPANKNPQALEKHEQTTEGGTDCEPGPVPVPAYTRHPKPKIDPVIAAVNGSDFSPFAPRQRR